ncbi:MAG: YqhA family protein [Saprospiraceae bacterium]|nr:YqhA family protein [Saprospiraceae bacterium]
MHRLLNISIFIVVFITFINAMVFFALGIYHSVLAYIDVATGHMDNHPGIVLVESLDRFLFGFVFIIFSIGLSRLFLADFTFLKNYELPWLKITEFHQLKSLLVSAVLVALLVAWAPFAVMFTQQDKLDWTYLLFPACILILSVSAKFIKDSY